MRISGLAVRLILWGSGWVTPLVAQDHRGALLQADRRAAQLASDSGLATAVRRVLHRDGVLLWPDAPILAGTTQIKDFLASRSRSTALSMTWEPLEVELSQDSTLAALWGVVVVNPQTPAGTGLGRFISMWGRDQSGWTMTGLVLIGSNIPAAPPLPPGIPLSSPAARFSPESQPFVAADLAFAHLARDSGAATAFRTWADDGALIFGGGGLLTRGPAAIGRAVGGPERWDWHPVMAGGAPAGDLGWTTGEAVITGKEGTASYSKYLTVWVRRGGATRFLLDGGNARPRSP
ncbi:MAG TPA: hypothetical protein VFZ87_08830 [Gemmatimonadales bacterium]